MLYQTSAPFVANTTSFQEVTDVRLDQLKETGVPGRIRWESIFWQIREVGKVGALRFRIEGSLDGSNWDLLAGVVTNPTEGEVNEPDLNPGGLVEFILTTELNPILMAYRHYRVTVASPTSNPNTFAQASIVVYAR